MPFTYQLPPNDKDDTNTPIAMPTEVNSVIIIGANGSGKSKLGAWIENQNRKDIHRIGAQRYLSWKDTLTPKNLKLLENTILYGLESVSADNVNSHIPFQWKDGKTTTERRDVDAVLSAIFSKRTTQLENFDERLKSAPSQQLPREPERVNDFETQLLKKIV